MGVEFKDGALRRRLAEDDLRARMDVEGMRRDHEAALAPRGLGCAALPVAMLERTAGGAARSPWTYKADGDGGKWANAYVLVGSHIVDLEEPAALDGDNYVKVTLGMTPAEDTGSIVDHDDGPLCFLVGKVQDGRQVSGIYTIPVVLTWE